MGTLSRRAFTASYLRNFVFGVEDSLVSTVGLLSGIAIAGAPAKTIFTTGIILIFVEAFSMAAGSFLSEHSAEDFIAQTDAPLRRPLLDGVIMFFSYFASGFVPLFPYIFFLPEAAFWLSIACSLFALFALGAIGAKISRLSILKNGLRMFIIGGIAIAVGILAGGLAYNINM